MPKPRTAKRWLVLIIVILASIVGSTWMSYGQESEPPHILTESGRTIARIARPTAEPASVVATAPISPADQAADSATATPTPIPPVYLALLRTPPRVMIEFDTQETDDHHPIHPSTTFAYGIKTLYYFVTLDGAQGIPYHEEWTINGIRETRLDYNGSAPYDTTYYADGIRYTSNAPLVPGAYQLTIFLNNVPYKHETAVIQ